MRTESKLNVRQIGKLQLFERIREEDLQAMIECAGGKVYSYKKGEIIILTDDHVRNVGVVLSGCVHMVKESPSGDEVLLTIIREGELFGESFALGDEALAYTTFRADKKTEILSIPFQKIMNTCTNECPFHHQLIKNVVVMIANKNVRLMEKIDVSSRKGLREKIIAYIELEAKKQNNSRVELKHNRTVWADYLGVNRSALARELTGMKEEGILDFEGNQIWFKDC